MGETKYEWTDKTKTGFSKEEFDALWTTVNAIPIAYDIDDLDDVVITSVADHELLAWDAGTAKWINMTPTEVGLDAIYEALGHNHDTDYLQLSGGTVTGDLVLSAGMFNLGAATEVTIDSGGEITVTKSRHRVDTYADAGSDSLDTINGGTDGDILILQNVSGARFVNVTDNVGNIQLSGSPMALNNPRDTLMLIYDSLSSKWLELSRSNNA